MTNESVKSIITAAKSGLSIILYSLSIILISILSNLIDNFDKISYQMREI